MIKKLSLSLILVACIALTGCSSTSDDAELTTNETDNDISSSEDTVSTTENIGTTSDLHYPTQSESTGSLTYHGYPCTYDCSGHEAGHQWAEDNAVSDEAQCDGNSDSFNEGCRSYVEENGSTSSSSSSEEDEGSDDSGSGEE